MITADSDSFAACCYYRESINIDKKDSWDYLFFAEECHMHREALRQLFEKELRCSAEIILHNLWSEAELATSSYEHSSAAQSYFLTAACFMSQYPLLENFVVRQIIDAQKPVCWLRSFYQYCVFFRQQNYSEIFDYLRLKQSKISLELIADYRRFFAMKMDSCSALLLSRNHVMPSPLGDDLSEEERPRLWQRGNS